MFVNSTIGINKIKYIDLDSILNIPEGIEDVNFFIDGHSLLNFMYRENIQSDLASSPQDMIISIVNSCLSIIEHYRNYLSKKGYNNTFYFLFNRELPKFQNKIIPFGNNFYDRYSNLNQTFRVANYIIDEAMHYLEEVVRYVPRAYYIDNTGVLDCFAMKYIISQNDGFNIVLTKDKLIFQLVSSKTVILRPKKDHHYVITKDNFFEKLTEEHVYNVKHIDYTMYPFILIINGVKEMDVIPINTGFIKLLKLLDKLVEEEILDNGISSKSFIRIFNEFMVGNENNEKLLTDRYLALICKNIEVIDKADREKINYSMDIDLYDLNGLEALNDYLDAENKINVYNLYKTGKKKPNMKNSYINW